jgi:hypothetical protein
MKFQRFAAAFGGRFLGNELGASHATALNERYGDFAVTTRRFESQRGITTAANDGNYCTGALVLFDWQT